MTRRNALPELIFLWLSFFLMSSAVLVLLIKGDDVDQTGTIETIPVITGAYGLVYLIAGLEMLRRPSVLLREMNQHRYLVAFMVLALLSAAWSDLPGLTIKRAVALSGATLVGLYLAVRFPPRSFVSMVVPIYLALLLLSVLFVSVLPEYGLHEKYDFAWRGVFPHKNGMGHIAAQAVILFAALALTDQKRKLRYMAGLALAGLILFMADSMTAVLGVTAALGMLVLRRLIRHRSPLLLFGALVFVTTMGAAAYFVAQNWMDLLLMIGKDPSMTGRTVAWTMAFQGGLERPILGYGFRSFWLPWSDNAAVLNYLAWDLSSGHNSYLDIWLELGLVGLGLFGLVLLGFWRDLLRVMCRDNGLMSVLLPMMAAYLCVAAIARTMLPDHHAVEWVWMVVLIVYARRLLKASPEPGVALNKQPAPAPPPAPASGHND